MTVEEGARAVLPEVHQVAGGRGPTLSLLGAVHGNELLGVLAIRQLVGLIDPATLRGRIRWAAPAHPRSWVTERRAGPEDGLNLARVFPGSANGAPTERVAAYLTSELIAGSDLLVDLHTAGAVSDMPLLCGYRSEGPLAPAAAAAAAAFAAPFTWKHPGRPSLGRSLFAADQLGIPSVYMESAGGMVVRHAQLTAYVEGLQRIMAHLGMVDRAPPASPTILVSGDGNTDVGISGHVDGYFASAVSAGELVPAGGLLGTIIDESGIERARIVAPTTGYVMMIRLSARVMPGDTLALVSAAA